MAFQAACSIVKSAGQVNVACTGLARSSGPVSTEVLVVIMKRGSKAVQSSFLGEHRLNAWMQPTDQTVEVLAHPSDGVAKTCTFLAFGQER